ncbi:hypothetical protein [Syntrophobotulus glycolicus]|uniref:hypothetical protein n=1 Tax=Syntrophobotulus glycolicus TaxID=51197 RepID=UPI0002D58BD8|nr:hypothetical protein [Syntrophobotulus glycolicus]
MLDRNVPGGNPAGSVNDLSQISAWQVVFYFDPRARLDMGVLDATLKIGMGLTPKEDII